jgi:spore maturation protein CgeB
MRLYEATGVGSMLLTDAKSNLHELFEPDAEVVTYCDADELAGRIEYFLDHDEERRAIARAGQERTLRDHTYAKRMEELLILLGESLRR